MVYNGESCQTGWFGGTPISGNHHFAGGGYDNCDTLGLGLKLLECCFKKIHHGTVQIAALQTLKAL